MLKKQIHNVFDLGPGDGGKGGIVQKLAQHHKAHTVVKVGGAQGSHGVVTTRNKFAFSQWGCGSFDNIPTHITNRMIISPIGLLNEADALRYTGITDAFDLLTIDERAICATPFHGIVSRITEMSRKDKPRGTIGTGVGQAFRDQIKLTAAELLDRKSIINKLTAIRDHQIQSLNWINNCDFWDSDKSFVNLEYHILKENSFLDHVIDEFCKVGKQLVNAIVPFDHLEREILTKNGSIVVESSHGVLTDSVVGLCPHVSAIRTLPALTTQLFEKFDGEIVNVGVHRAYSIRHGAGPLPTSDKKEIDSLLPGSHKESNRFQGDVRVGPLDLNLLKYAINKCGGPQSINYLAITWFDQIVKRGIWGLCDKYEFPEINKKYFTDNGNIIHQNLNNEEQQELTNELFKAQPVVYVKAIDGDRDSQHELCHNELFKHLQIPVKLVSFGPLTSDKSIR